MARTKVVILGAAGRDFHNFNVIYRDRPDIEVVAFTATQIPGIERRRYPPELAGPNHPDGIPIVAEDDLEELCRARGVTQIDFAYSDVPHEHVMHLAARAVAIGADFHLPGPDTTMIAANRPVIAVTAVRTGCGKSQTSRMLAAWLAERGFRVAALRHPMPYGDLARQRVQRFASLGDLDQAQCTVEEREEYEPYIAQGHVVFAGVDYSAILAEAEREADLILWDGGNNDYPFLRPDLHIALADALRPGQATTHYPGEAVLRMADVLLVNKVNAAPPEQVEQVVAEVRALNGDAPLVRAASLVTLDPGVDVAGKRVLVVEDGPTITHGGQPTGAGYAAARDAGADIVDPRPYASPALADVYERYPQIGPVLPAVGYGREQLRALAATINAAEVDLVVSGTPADIASLMSLERPVVRAHYGYADAGEPTLTGIVADWLAARGIEPAG